MLKRLLDIGFREEGKWTLTEDKIVATLGSEANSRNILYAFVDERKVLYIGKTTQALRVRINGYQNPGPTQSTNIRINKKLKEQLDPEKTGSKSFVSILVLPDHGLLKYGGFHLNLAAGLEDSIIKELNPEWNINH